jgi:hypothetical protein
LPGAYLSRPAPEAFGGGDPGAAYLRVALVEDAARVETGLTAIRDCLGQ